MHLYIYHIFFIHLSVGGHLSCFHVLAIVNSAAENIEVHASFQYRVFSGYMHRSGIAEPYGSSLFSFLFVCLFIYSFILFLVMLGLCCCMCMCFL